MTFSLHVQTSSFPRTPATFSFPESTEAPGPLLHQQHLPWRRQAEAGAAFPPQCLGARLGGGASFFFKARSFKGTEAARRPSMQTCGTPGEHVLRAEPPWKQRPREQLGTRGQTPPPPAQGSRREQRAARARKEQRAKECAVTSGPEKRGGTMAAGDPATAPEPGGWPPALPHSGLGSTLMPVCAGSTAGRLPVPPELGTCPHGAQCCLTNRRPGHLGPLSQLTPQGFRCGSGLPALASFSHPQRERNSRLPRGRTGPPLVWGEPCPPRAAPSPQEPIPQTHWWWVPPPTSQAED